MINDLDHAPVAESFCPHFSLQTSSGVEWARNNAAYFIFGYAPLFHSVESMFGEDDDHITTIIIDYQFMSFMIISINSDVP